MNLYTKDEVEYLLDEAYNMGQQDIMQEGLLSNNTKEKLFGKDYRPKTKEEREKVFKFAYNYLQKCLYFAYKEDPKLRRAIQPAKKWFGSYDFNEMYDRFINYDNTNKDENYITLAFGDLWKYNPEARTDEETNEKAYNRIYDICNRINEKLQTFTDYSKEFKVTPGYGDWDDLVIELVELKHKKGYFK